MADIVDNSIAANATQVDLWLGADHRGQIRLSIVDNGDGMDRSGLINAMQYGSKARPSAASLGKYGLGLKTASTAFCKRLSVVSRPDGATLPLMATWDLEHVAKVRKWSLLLSEDCDPEAVEHLNDTATNHAGTVVLWDNVDRLIKEYQNRTGNHARKALKSREESLRNHLAMVYQRFLDPSDARARNVCIRLNGVAVDAWDPFQRGISELVAQDEITTELPDGKKATFTVKAYILPRREEFPNDKLAQAAQLSNERLPKRK